MAKPSPGTVMLTPTIPTPLARLYAATQAERARLSLPPLPTISHLLAAAMRAELLSRGIPASHPALQPPAPSRTSSATAARSRKRLASTKPQTEPSPAHEAHWCPGPRCPGCQAGETIPGLPYPGRHLP